MGQREPTARADGPCTQEEGQMLTVVRDSGRAKENRDEARVAPTGRAKVRSRIIASVARARDAWKAPGPAGSLHAAARRVQMNQRVGEEKADHALVRVRFVCGCLNGRVNGWRGVL